MLNKKPITLILYTIPFFIVLALSGYYTYISWQKYRENALFLDALKNVKNLQKYEKSIIDKSLCMVLNDIHNADKICKKEHLKTLELRQVLNAKEESLEHWMSQAETFQQNVNHETIKRFENLLGKNGSHSMVKSYLDGVEFRTNTIEEKELLRLYEDLVDISYATLLERFLVTYYVEKKVEIPAINLIYWDKIMQASYMPNILQERYIDSVKQSLLKISKNEKLQKISQLIDEMRINILTGQIGKSKNEKQWVTLLKEKDKSLQNMKSIIERTLDKNIGYRMHIEKYKALLFFTLFVMILFSLFWIYRQYKNEVKENKSLAELLSKINALTAYGSAESNVMQKMLTNVKSKADIYKYIYSSFQLINEKHYQAKDEAVAKSQFLSTLSHEIRTPLNGIIGFSKLLKDMGVTTDQKEFLSLIESSSHNLIAIVNDVLDLSKINAAKMEIENVSFDIVKTIETTIAPFTHQADQKDIELGLFIDPFLNENFFGDDTKLSQVLTNLVGNAIKFTEAYGKINIFVQCMHDAEKNAQIKFAVQDDGIGLSQEQIENIFNAFSQATKTTSKIYGGTGLGLTISRKMVELMGGKLEVESKEGKGATFFFTLNLQKDKKHIVNEVPRFPDISVGLALPVKSIKRQLDTNLEIYIRHLGAEFSYYYYDDLFENTAKVRLPDIMIFDHHYARLSGELEQCASVKCQTVLLTNGALRSRINSDKHHFDDIILTPVSLRKSIRILENTLKKREHQLLPIEKKKKTLVKESTFHGLHALVADDNVINRKLIKIILEKIGLKVTLTSNGEEVSAAYKNGEYDIIFMDIQMPVMDGVEATRVILDYEAENQKKHTPIIAVTANVATHDKEHYLSEGMDDYATKPLEIQILKTMITKHCNVEA
jgi:signal transduction histidine kinase/CheY-like chemotaxis protein